MQPSLYENTSGGKKGTGVFFFFFVVPLSTSVCPHHMLDASFPARGNFLVNSVRLECIKQEVLCMQSCTLRTLFPNLGERKPLHWTKHHTQERDNGMTFKVCDVYIFM